MGSRAFNILSLCTGAGGLDLGLQLAVRNACTVCYVEREAFCCEILAARMAEKCLDEAPIWTDLRTFDGRPWRGIVDCVIGGYPCQPFSVFGTKRGEHDKRFIWPEIARIIGEVQPAWCFFENVRGHLRLGFERVARELLGLGFRVSAGLFTAAEIGAPHRRTRLFILANAVGRDLRGQQPISGGPEKILGIGWPGASMGERHIDYPGFPPRPDDAFSWGEYLRRGDAPQPTIHRSDDGMANRVDRLRALGNGVIPAMAVLAWSTLYAQLMGASRGL